MQKQTVEYGIDLGTTNSAVARATPSGMTIIKNRFQSDTTPSAVARRRSGQILVGQDALAKPELSPATRFKRIMGTTNRTALADESEWLPEELSAEVLKELKASIQLRYDEQPTHAVITVPAMFQQPQCEATHRAAKIAGLTAVCLLQEPIAAATAFLGADSGEGCYIVYDLGGGTFDVSVVRLRNNEMSVVAHGGDNYLGGSDFDQKIADWVVQGLERQYGALPELQQGVANHMLFQACERAKIDLSARDHAVIDLGDLELPIAQIPITRAELEDIVGDVVTRTIRLTRERLEQANLRTQDVHRLLLVGGPTMTPFIRRRLKDEIGVALSFDQDPMTVVAMGAAITASSILIPTRASMLPSHAQSVVMELYYEPTAPDLECSLSGKIMEPLGFSGEVRVSRRGGDWETGWLPLRGGAFLCDLHLRPRGVTEFEISVRNLQGTTHAVTPLSVSIRYGLAAAVPVTPYDLGVALSDGSFNVVVPRNQPLPAVGTTEYRIVKAIPAGSAEELHVHFLEGHSRVAADNVQVGELVIRGQDLPRTLREGERVDVRILMDESRRLTARVQIPILDLDFPVHLTSMIEKPPVADLQASVAETMASVSRIGDVVEPEDETRLRQTRRDLEQVEADLEQAELGNVGAAERTHQKLMPLRADLREMESKYALQAAMSEAIEEIVRAKQIAENFQDSMGVAEAEDLREEAERCRRLSDARGLKAVKERAEALFWRHYLQTRECWIGYIEWLRGERRLAREALPFDEYLKRAEDCLLRDDYEGVRLNGLQAASYLPETTIQKSRFGNAGLTK